MKLSAALRTPGASWGQRRTRPLEMNLFESRAGVASPAAARKMKQWVVNGAFGIGIASAGLDIGPQSIPEVAKAPPIDEIACWKEALLSLGRAGTADQAVAAGVRLLPALARHGLRPDRFAASAESGVCLYFFSGDLLETGRSARYAMIEADDDGEFGAILRNRRSGDHRVLMMEGHVEDALAEISDFLAP